MQPEDGHYQAPKHVVLPYVENTLYSTNKYSYVRPVHTLYISYLTEHNVDDEPCDFINVLKHSREKCHTIIGPLIQTLLYSHWTSHGY